MSAVAKLLKYLAVNDIKITYTDDVSLVRAVVRKLESEEISPEDELVDILDEIQTSFEKEEWNEKNEQKLLVILNNRYGSVF